MPSLRSMIIDGRIGLPVRGPEGMRERFEERQKLTVDSLKSHDTILVNIDPVAADIQTAIKERTQAEFEQLADMKHIAYAMPPYSRMWLEGKGGELHVGFLVRRDHIKSMSEAVRQKFAEAKERGIEGAETLEQMESLVRSIAWLNLGQGRVCFLGEFGYGLDANGGFMGAHFRSLLDETKEPEHDVYEFGNSFMLTTLWITHAFSRMNCHNVKLVPMPGGPRIKPGLKRPPFSVWHEITVQSKEEMRRELKGEAAPDGEKREMRFHNVRGHYADYTKGKGLFGRYKVRLWIEEHTKGNPDLGTVMSSYKVS